MCCLSAWVPLSFWEIIYWPQQFASSMSPLDSSSLEEILEAWPSALVWTTELYLLPATFQVPARLQQVTLGNLDWRTQILGWNLSRATHNLNLVLTVQ